MGSHLGTGGVAGALVQAPLTSSGPRFLHGKPQPCNLLLCIHATALCCIRDVPDGWPHVQRPTRQKKREEFWDTQPHYGGDRSEWMTAAPI